MSVSAADLKSCRRGVCHFEASAPFGGIARPRRASVIFLPLPPKSLYLENDHHHTRQCQLKASHQQSVCLLFDYYCTTDSIFSDIGAFALLTRELFPLRWPDSKMHLFATVCLNSFFSVIVSGQCHLIVFHSPDDGGALDCLVRVIQLDYTLLATTRALFLKLARVPLVSFAKSTSTQLK